jgi:hypothetical protein
MRLLYSILFLGICSSISAQSIEFSGVIKGNDDLDGVHVINNASRSYTVTNVFGEFKVKAKVNDTIIFSSILFKLKKVVVSPQDAKNKFINVALQTFVNELNEVVLGRVLTGDLMSDVKNMGSQKQITFADVGIPGYTGKPLTQSERRLKTAGDFKPIMLLGLLGGSMPLDPLINAITGRTKELKTRVSIERKTLLLKRLKQTFADSFFDQYPLPEDKKEEFFMFCSDQNDFEISCNDLKLNAFNFLTTQYPIYLQRLAEK